MSIIPSHHPPIESRWDRSHHGSFSYNDKEVVAVTNRPTMVKAHTCKMLVITTITIIAICTITSINISTTITIVTIFSLAVMDFNSTITITTVAVATITIMITVLEYHVAITSTSINVFVITIVAFITSNIILMIFFVIIISCVQFYQLSILLAQVICWDPLTWLNNIWYLYVYIYTPYIYVFIIEHEDMNKRNTFSIPTGWPVVVQEICWCLQGPTSPASLTAVRRELQEELQQAQNEKPSTLHQQHHHHHHHQQLSSPAVIISNYHHHQQQQHDSVEGRMTPREIVSLSWVGLS